MLQQANITANSSRIPEIPIFQALVAIVNTVVTEIAIPNSVLRNPSNSQTWCRGQGPSVGRDSYLIIAISGAIRFNLL